MAVEKEPLDPPEEACRSQPSAKFKGDEGGRAANHQHVLKIDSMFSSADMYRGFHRTLRAVVPTFSEFPTLPSTGQNGISPALTLASLLPSDSAPSTRVSVVFTPEEDQQR